MVPKSIGFLIDRPLSGLEEDLFTTLGEAIGHTNYTVFVYPHASAQPLIKGLDAANKDHTKITKGLFITCERVIVYATDQSIALIDSRNAWGEANSILLPGTGHLEAFVRACVAADRSRPPST